MPADRAAIVRFLIALVVLSAASVAVLFAGHHERGHIVVVRAKATSAIASVRP